MKGIILAGGLGTRLHPAPLSISKNLLPIYDKPMIYYPLATLMLAGIKDILIITNLVDNVNFTKLLGNGSKFGINIQYQIQYLPKGIVDALLIGEEFIGEESVALILGDNIFYGQGLTENLQKLMNNNIGATIFGYMVKEPQRFGVVEFDTNNQVISLEEKPQDPRSNYAVTGLYLYDNKVFEYAKQLAYSSRGELEITDLNKIYLTKQKLKLELLGKGFAWLDTGTHEAMLQASNFVRSIEMNKGIKIACLEEIALLNGFIEPAKTLADLQQYYGSNEYFDYVKLILNTKYCLSKDQV